MIHDIETEEHFIVNLNLLTQAKVEDLQKEIKAEEGLDPKDYRLSYVVETQKFPVEEEELIADIVRENGHFEGELKKYGSLRRQMEISCESSDLIGHVALLLGPPKKFEHYVITRNHNRFKFQSGKINSQYGKVIIQFGTLRYFSSDL